MRSQSSPRTLSEPRYVARPVRNGITIATVSTLIGLVLAAIGFFSTYVFATKADLVTTEKEISRVSTAEQLTDASVKALQSDVAEIKTNIKGVEVEQRVTNENLRRLLRRRGIKPASREEMEELWPRQR